MTPLLIVLNVANALILAAILVLLLYHWRAYTRSVAKAVFGLVVTALLVCAAMMFVKGAFPYLEGWAAFLVVVGFLSGFLERRHQKRMRAEGMRAP